MSLIKDLFHQFRLSNLAGGFSLIGVVSDRGLEVLREFLLLSSSVLACL